MTCLANSLQLAITIASDRQREVPADKIEAYQRNRNLFYVVCSRPKRRLALLFTQELTTRALETLAKWFGSAAICALPNR